MTCVTRYYILAFSLMSRKKATEVAFWWFLLRGISYPRLRLGGQCELFVVCVYVVLLFTSTPDVLSTLLLFALSKLCRPIIRKFCANNQ